MSAKKQGLPVFDPAKAKAILEASLVKTYAGLARAMGLERQTVGHWFRRSR
jgi:hypothetical protein